MLPGLEPSASIPWRKPTDWSPVEVGTFATLKLRVPSSISSRSVNVPPTSTPTTLRAGDAVSRPEGTRRPYLPACSIMEMNSELVSKNETSNRKPRLHRNRPGQVKRGPARYDGAARACVGVSESIRQGAVGIADDFVGRAPPPSSA